MNNGCMIHNFQRDHQEGSLCAQHCLNTLLQGQYFSPVDLAEIARQLDDCERERMAEGGTQTAEYMSFMEQPSSNMDDSGFFSIQVISRALRVWSLEVVPFSSQDAVAVSARSNPVLQIAFICNFREHWFTIRKLGNQWFNLNSLLTGPELISDTYLSLFLTQLQQEGYSIFIPIGDLPNCDADDLLKTVCAVQVLKPSLISDKSKMSTDESQDSELERALAESKVINEQDDKVLQETLSLSRTREEEELLRQAIEMSVRDSQPGTSHPPPHPIHIPHPPTQTPEAPVDLHQLRELRLAHLSQTSNPHLPVIPTVSEEDQMLQEAIRLSMEQP